MVLTNNSNAVWSLQTKVMLYGPYKNSNAVWSLQTTVMLYGPYKQHVSNLVGHLHIIFIM